MPGTKQGRLAAPFFISSIGCALGNCRLSRGRAVARPARASLASQGSPCCHHTATGLTASLSRRTRMRWWLFPLRSQHPAELHPNQSRTGTSVSPFAAGHQAEVSCTRLWSAQLLQQQCHLCSTSWPGIMVMQGLECILQRFITLQFCW